MKIIKILFIIILILFALMFFGFRYIGVPLAIKKHTEFVDFNNIKFPNTPNFYYSPAKKSVFNIPVSILKQYWEKMITQQPRVIPLLSKDNGDQKVYVQLSAFWHFPDFIDVKFIALGQNRSSIEIYSRSQFGYSDLGVNKKRVERWLLLLKRSI